MIELGPGATLFRMAGGLIWLLVICVLLAAWALPKTKRGKAVTVTAALGALLLFPGRQIVEMYQQERASQTRLAEAEKRFQERCKTAGEFIQKTVDNVEGILLLKVRPSEINFGAQFKMDDPYGRDLGGDGYIESLVRGGFQSSHQDIPVSAPPRLGYRYVDIIDSTGGKRYRYTGAVKVVGRKDHDAPNIQAELARNPSFDLNNYAFVLDKVPATGPAPRYGVTYDDISTHEDREYWIAGSSLRVIDLQANEVMAERIGYMMDPGQGATGQGGSNPAWDRARRHACPTFSWGHTYQTLDFVEKVLKHPKEQ